MCLSVQYFFPICLSAKKQPKTPAWTCFFFAVLAKKIPDVQYILNNNRVLHFFSKFVFSPKNYVPYVWYFLAESAKFIGKPPKSTICMVLFGGFLAQKYHMYGTFWYQKMAKSSVFLQIWLFSRQNFAKKHKI